LTTKSKVVPAKPVFNVAIGVENGDGSVTILEEEVAGN
jgi:hypothetical protein